MRTRRSLRKDYREDGTEEKFQKVKVTNEENEAKKDGSEETYVVERVIGERINEKTGKKHYLLKWQGYTSDDDTWEPEDHLECNELIEEFLVRTGRSAKGPNTAIVKVRVKRYGNILEYMETQERIAGSVITKSGEKISPEQLTTEKLNESAGQPKQLTSANSTASSPCKLIREANSKTVSGQKSDAKSKHSSAASEISSKISKSIVSSPLPCKLARTVELPSLHLPVPSHLSQSEKKQSLTSVDFSSTASKSLNVDSDVGTKVLALNETSDSEDDEKSLEYRRHPLPGDSLMEKGATPQFILTVVEPHEEHPLSYIVKYKNIKNMECVPSDVISKMWPQVVIDFYEKWLTESNA